MKIGSDYSALGQQEGIHWHIHPGVQIEYAPEFEDRESIPWVRYTDLGPFRAIGSPYLARLGMRDRDYGWTVEMQIKAAVMGIRAMEVPVDYRKRIGVSKVSGSLKGVILAGIKILYTIFRSVLEPAVRRRKGEKKVLF